MNKKIHPIAWIAVFIILLVLLVQLVSATPTQTSSSNVISLTNSSSFIQLNETANSTGGTAWNMSVYGNSTWYLNIPKNSIIVSSGNNITGYVNTSNVSSYSPLTSWGEVYSISNILYSYDGQPPYPGNTGTGATYTNPNSNNNHYFQCMIDSTTWGLNIEEGFGGVRYLNLSLGVCANIDNKYIFRYVPKTDTGGIYFNFSYPSGGDNTTIPNISIAVTNGVFSPPNIVYSVLDMYVYWNIINPTSNSLNTYQVVGASNNPTVFNQADNHTTSNITSNYSLNISSYLSSATSDVNGTVNVPVIIHSDTAVIKRISNISVVYNYNVSSLFSVLSGGYDQIRTGINITHTTQLNTSGNNISATFNLTGYYLNYTGNNPISCKINGTSYSVSGLSGSKYCSYDFNVSKSNQYPNHTIVFDKGIIITQSVANISWYNTSIVVGENVSGFYNFTLINTDTIAYNGVLSNYTTGDDWINTSTADEYLNFIAGETKTNKTVNITNITVFEGTYSIVKAGGVIDQYTYSNNLTVIENNITPNLTVRYKIPTARLTEWTLRDTALDTYTVDGNTVGVTYTYDAVYVYLDVNTSHGSSSLSEGIHPVSYIYYVTASSSGSTAPGGGGGSYVGNLTIVVGSGNFSLTQPGIYIQAPPCSNVTSWVIVYNQGNTEVSPDLTCESTGSFCNYVSFKQEVYSVVTGDRYENYSIPAGQVGKIPININIPCDLDTSGTCSAKIIPGRDYPFSIRVKIGENEQVATATLCASKIFGGIGGAIVFLNGCTPFGIYCIPNFILILGTFIGVILLIIFIGKKTKVIR